MHCLKTSPSALHRRLSKPLTVLIAPSGFKESLSAEDAAEHIATGVLRALPQARVLKAPMADGGEGFTQALVHATGGTLHHCTVTGPVGEPVDAHFGFLGGRARRTAVIEMAAAAGLRLVPRDRRNPMLTTSRGVGELIRAALDAGAQRVLLGCGDSGINDGGAGMVQALGARLLDAQGRELAAGGGELQRLCRIDLRGLDPRLARVTLDAAVNWHNVLLGERGVARVFGPQKGATPAQVDALDAALTHYAACIQQATGRDIGQAPGSGASGGLGAGFAALLGGTLHPRFDIVMQYLELDSLIAQADLVITAEGSLDHQTPYGKVPAEVAQRAKRRGLPVIALAGTIGAGVEINFEHGIDAFASILSRPCTLDEAIAQAGPLLQRAAEDALRMVAVGMGMGAIRSSRQPKRQSAAATRPSRARTPALTTVHASAGSASVNEPNDRGQTSVAVSRAMSAAVPFKGRPSAATSQDEGHGPGVPSLATGRRPRGPSRPNGPNGPSSRQPGLR